jgi:DNA-binding HxlR family transcriptional regulator
MRYSEISPVLVGVSQKMLTQALRTLERDGLLTRSVTPTVPVTVFYELTDLGLSFHHMTRGLRSWAQAHMTEVCRSMIAQATTPRPPDTHRVAANNACTVSMAWEARGYPM